MKTLKFIILLCSLLVGVVMTFYVMCSFIIKIYENGYKQAVSDYVQTNRFKYDYQLESKETKIVVIKKHDNYKHNRKRDNHEK